MSKKNIFNDNWLLDTQFSQWFQKSDTKGKACCIFCSKDFDISNIGVGAFMSHLSGKKHAEIGSLRISQTGAMFLRWQSQISCEISSKHSTVGIMIIPASMLRAEILWTLKVVTNHFSLQSCLGLNELFQVMFLDCKIATSFLLSKFKELLTKAVRTFPFFILSFDESVKNILQKDQMDLQVRY